jgi:hypothetical protein
MEIAAEAFWIVIYQPRTLVGLVLFGLIVLLVLATVYLVERPDG